MCMSSNENSTTLVISGHCEVENVIDPTPLLSKQRHSGNCNIADGAVNVPTLQSIAEAQGNAFKKSLSFHEIREELAALSRIATPTMITGLLIYLRNAVSMVFLGHIGKSELAAGSLAVGFANITGYSIIFGLAMGIEPICGQAYGARNFKLLTTSLQRSVLMLFLMSLLISIFWLNIDHILIGQDQSITKQAKTYLLYSLPDLLTQSVLHPLRIYLRAQNITRPIAFCSIIATVIHIPTNYILLNILSMGIKGVAIASVLTNLNLLTFLVIYLRSTKVLNRTWVSRGLASLDCFKELGTYMKLAIPSCASICLEWWWYEVMIILCGLLESPEDTVAAIGIVMQMTSLVYVFPSSVSYGVSTRVAQELGAGRADGARRAAAVGTSVGAAIGAAAMVFTVAGRGWWGGMFAGGAEGEAVRRLTAGALGIVGMGEVGNCLQTVMCGVVRGSGRVEVAARVNLGGFYGVGMPVAVGVGFGMGVGFEGLWVGLVGAEVACAVMLGVVVVGVTDWGEQVRRAEQISGEVMVQTRQDGEGEENDLEVGNRRIGGVL